ncbi:MAG: hypothetical protein Q8904_15460, partial [Bacteroidota bacterium]|nr:hypothetical protein [Bacteroidota bacterium]
NMIRDAMTAEASKLTDHGQFTEAMGILNASGNYNLQSGNKRSPADSVLIGKLSQRLYSAYLDFALESLNFDIYSVTLDYYQKAMSLKQSNMNMIHPDVRERYVADKICKAMLASAEKLLLGKDKETALATYENVVRIADAARLKSDYETARIHLEQLSNRPSGYRPWVGKDVAVVVPFQEIKNINERSMSAYKKSKLRERDSLAALAITGQKVKTKTNLKTKDENADNENPVKAVLTKSQLQDVKDSVFLSKIIKRLQANRIMKANSDSLVLSKLDKRIRINKAKNNKDSLTYLTSIKKNTIEKIKVQRSKDSLLLAANCKNFQAIQLRLSKMKGSSNLALAGKQSFQARKSEKMDDNAALRAVDQNENHLPAGKLTNKKTVPIKMALQTELTTAGKRVEPVNIAEVKKQVNANIKNIHLRIWSGDTLISAVMLNKTDSLQQLLILAGDRSLEPDVRALRLYYDETRCEQQKMDYMRELDQVRNLLKSNDYAIAARLLQQLISKSFSASCKVDKSEAIRLLASLEAPMIYKKWLDQLDSISRTEEPGKIMDAFEKARAYYKLNMSEKPGFAPPDFMSALKSRKETPFLLKAVSLMLDTNRPIYALDLMKEIRKMESKPDVTLSLQKRLGEMLASGDYSNLKKSNDMLNAYNINEKWYEVLISAYKRQWKLFSK